MPKNTLIKIFLTTIILPLLLSTGCSSDNPTEPADNGTVNRGTLINAEFKTQFSIQTIQQAIQNLDSSSTLQAQYGIQVYSLTYETIDPDGNLTEASGALFVPVGGSSLPMVSLQHGTQSERNRVGSVSPIYSPGGIFFSAVGYLACEPDYLGLGVSTILHPYHYAKTSATATIDFIRAAKEFCSQNSIELNRQLFLAGYSEGGYVTMATQKEIEENYSDEFTITASAPMAGAYDLKSTAKSLIQESSYGKPSFLAFLITAYNDIYNWNKLNDIFQSPYAGMMNTLFDGSLTTDQIDDRLPSSQSELFKQSFVNSFLNGNETEIDAALEENTLLNWNPIAPIKLYHGDADEYVPYQNSQTALENLRAHGAQIDLVTIQNGTHVGSAVSSYEMAIIWFNTFRTSQTTIAVNY